MKQQEHSMEPYRGDYVGGRFVLVSPSHADCQLLSISPRDVTDEVWRGYGSLTAVDRAVAAAQNASDTWAGQSLSVRYKFLNKIKAQLRNECDPLINLLARELGLPRWQGQQEYLRCLTLFDELKSACEAMEEAGLREGPELQRVALGVVAILPDFSSPLQDLLRGVLAALLTGNTVVVAPHPYSSALGTRFAGLLDEADLPRGVFNLVHADRDGRAALASHPGLQGVRLCAAGSELRRIEHLLSTQPWKRLRVRSPGKNPMLVLPGADLDRAARDAVLGAYLNAGQSGTSTRWLIVHRKFEGALCEALQVWAGRIQVGDPYDEDTVMGPLASESIRRAFLRHVRQGEAEGCSALRGTGLMGHEPVGWYVAPALHRVGTIMENSRYQQHPVLGPDLPIFSVKSNEEAFALANSLDSALVSSIHTHDEKLQRQAVAMLRPGRVHLCTPTIAEHPRLPLFGPGRVNLALQEGPRLLEEWTILRSQLLEADPNDALAGLPAGLSAKES